MFRIIIAGSRDYVDYNALSETMDQILSDVSEEIAVLCGKAWGADMLGERYAKERGYAIEYYPAEWKRHEKLPGTCAI